MARAAASAGDVEVNGHAAEWLRKGFPWVYPAEVVSRPGRAVVGAVVTLRAPGGEPLGAGLWDPGWVSVRRFRSDPGPVDAALVHGLLDRAAALREVVVAPDTTAFRLVHGENDGLPGVRVDVYGHHCVVSLDAPSLLAVLDPVCDWLERVRRPRGVHLAWRPDVRDSFRVEQAPLPAGLVRGHLASGPVRVTERGVAMWVRPDDAGKDVGIFPDLRELRAFLDPFWGGRRVLNTFAHTGLFTVCAIRGGAGAVTSVDLSELWLDRARDNVRLNELDPAGHDFLVGDTRQVLDRLRRTGERFDLVILDPPGFSHGPAGPWSAAREYGSLVTSALRVLERDGWLVTVLNVGEVGPREFEGMIAKGARKAARELQLLWHGGAAPDFPAAMWFPEGRYLKAAVWRAS